MEFNVVDSSMFIPCFSLSSPSVDWDHQLSFIEENNLDDMIIEDLPSKPYFHQEEHKGSINQRTDQSSSSCPSSLLTCLLESDRRRNLLMDDRYSLSSSEVHREINIPLTSFDPLMDTTVNEPIDQFVQQLIEMKSDGIITSKAKANKSEGGRTSCSSAKKTSLEPAVKKPRIEMPSPLPTFNVRKDKLQDRITALQQLVSPFGKTDTASVLHEAIQYIKFLHDQIKTISTPYLRSDYPIQHYKNLPNEEGKSGEELIQDLRSRGLCLVPISCTFPFAVASGNNDFWSPPFGGF